MGGILSKPKVPSPPSAAEQAAAQQVSQFTPQGDLIYGSVGPNGEFIPGSGGTAINIYQTPFQEQIQALSESLGLDFAKLFGQNFGEQGLIPLQGDFTEAANKAEKSIFESGLAKLQPQFDKQKEQLQQQLADQGIPLNSPAYNKALKELDTNQNEALNQLSLSSTLAGLDEQKKLAQLQAAQSAQQYNQIGALLGFQTPFTPYPTTGVDLGGLYGSQLAGYNAQQQANQQYASNLANLGGSIAYLWSDRKTKKNIKYIGIENGHKVYSFEYLDSPKVYIGVMADEVEKTHPEAVREIDGIKHVNYSAIGVNFREAA